MKQINNEKGQALIIIALAAVVLIGFSALAVDGARAFEDKRHAQNAADTSALAGALAYQRGEDITTAAQDRATSNGYDDQNDPGVNDVTITITDIAEGSGICPGDAAGKEIQVDIETTVNTTLGRVLGRNTMTSKSTAVTHACGFILYDPFQGAAVAGTNPGPDCAFDSGNSGAVHWTLKDGGIFSNSCAWSKGPDAVTLDPDDCVQTVGTASGFTCTDPNQTSSAIPWPGGMAKMMPDNPCVAGGEGITPTAGQTTFTNGVYCISDFDALDGEDILLNNATLYVTDPVFSLKFAGGGGFNGAPTLSGTYAGYYLIVAFTPDNVCTDFNTNTAQTMVLRGNSGGTFSGTILAPSACLDVRGNGEPSGINTQLIGYNVTSNGNGETYIQYSPNPDLFTPYNPTITLEQ